MVLSLVVTAASIGVEHATRTLACQLMELLFGDGFAQAEVACDALSCGASAVIGSVQVADGLLAQRLNQVTVGAAFFLA